MIIVIGGEKGGTGKTTIAVNLAVVLSGAGFFVALIDTDKQLSASIFCEIRDENGIIPHITCFQKYGKNLPQDVLNLAQKCDIIIVDAGGRDNLELRYSAGIADVLIIPSNPSQFDLWTLPRMEFIVKQARIVNSNLKAYFLLNKTSTNPLNTDANEAMKVIAEYEDFKIFNTRLHERVSYQRSVRDGRSITEFSDEKATDEFLTFFEELGKCQINQI